MHRILFHGLFWWYDWYWKKLKKEISLNNCSLISPLLVLTLLYEYHTIAIETVKRLKQRCVAVVRNFALGVACGLLGVPPMQAIIPKLYYLWLNFLALVVFRLPYTYDKNEWCSDAQPATHRRLLILLHLHVRVIKEIWDKIFHTHGS